MKRPRLTLSLKILLVAFLNFLLLGSVLAVFVRSQLNLDLGSFILSPARDRIHVAGYVPADELARWYGRASIFAFPSLDEGFGIPLLEHFDRIACTRWRGDTRVWLAADFPVETRDSAQQLARPRVPKP